MENLPESFARVTTGMLYVNLQIIGTPPSVDLSRVALSPLAALVPAEASRTLNLVLAAYALPVRSAFVFSLTCAQSSSSLAVSHL